MIVILFIGITLSASVGIIYFVIAQKSTTPSAGFSWKKCFMTGFQIYFVSLILGTLATIFFEHIYDQQNYKFSADLIIQGFGLLMYSILFSVFIVAPAIIIGLKSISKSSLGKVQKEIRFSAITLVLVVIVNLVMSGFFSNFEFVIFMSGYSFFGILTPWAFVKLTRVFET